MALITKKTKKPHRIQFTMSCVLHECYTAYQARARNLGLVINFRHDFEEWFDIQLEKIGQELNRIEAGQAGPEPASEANNFIDSPFDLEQYPGNKSADIS